MAASVLKPGCCSSSFSAVIHSPRAQAEVIVRTCRETQTLSESRGDCPMSLDSRPHDLLVSPVVVSEEGADADMVYSSSCTGPGGETAVRRGMASLRARS